MATTYSDLVKRDQSGATTNPNYSPYKDLADNQKRDGSTQYSPPPSSSSTSVVSSTPTTSSSSSSSSSSSGSNMDRNANPGEGWFYDAADGWKQIQSDAASAAAAAEERLRNSINSQWDSVFGYLDQVGGRLPTQYDTQSNQIGDLYSSSQGKLNDANDLSVNKIQNTKKQTLNALADDLRNALQAATVRLGSKGASNSSANDAYQYALAKSAAKQRGSVNMQASDQLATLQNQFNTQMANLEEWKSSKLTELGLWYEEAKNNLDYQRANASGQKAQALANLDAQLHQVALDRLQSIEDQANNWTTTVNAWLLEQGGKVDSALLGMNNVPQVMSYAGLNNGTFNTGASNPVLGAGYSSGGNTDEEVGRQALYAYPNLTNAGLGSGIQFS